MFYPEFPVPVGVLRSIARPTHDQLMAGQITDARARQGEGDLTKLLNSGETWVAG
jgi:2-oxoglutarate ferredoxin oxidoreductase subunit beta